MDERGAGPGTDERGARPGTDERGARPGTDNVRIGRVRKRRHRARPGRVRCGSAN